MHVFHLWFFLEQKDLKLFLGNFIIIELDQDLLWQIGITKIMHRQVKIIITQVYYNWKEGGLIKGREHILLEFIFHVAGANTISRFGEILKIIDELNSPEVLSKCSEKCKGEIIKLKK